jgi:hypothetical protein
MFLKKLVDYTRQVVDIGIGTTSRKFLCVGKEVTSDNTDELPITPGKTFLRDPRNPITAIKYGYSPALEIASLEIPHRDNARCHLVSCGGVHNRSYVKGMISVADNDPSFHRRALYCLGDRVGWTRCRYREYAYLYWQVGKESE